MKGRTMKWFTIPILAIAIALTILAALPFASGHAEDEASPVFGVKIPAGYRDWRLISVAHEEGSLNDLRAILGNDVAITAAREGKLPFPDGTIIARLAWSYDPLEESSKAFGRLQSFVAGPSKNGVQFMVKDSSKYVTSENEVKYWIKHFGVTREELERAVERVGNSAASVRKELRNLGP
jgi:hypothetical protein